MTEPPKQASLFPSTFEDNYLIRTLGSIGSDPSTAITELVANAWDAGATEVRIDVPGAHGEALVVRDDGCGMTREEFLQRWMTLGYDRRRHQGDQAEFPPSRAHLRRQAFGSNGAGRHGMLCFGNEYAVTTAKDGECRTYRVRATGGETPFSLVREDDATGVIRSPGTRLEGRVDRHLPDPERIAQVLASRFGVDPAFRVLVNGQPVSIEALPGALFEATVEVEGYDAVTARWVESPETDRTIARHGIAFWVHKRLVGMPLWSVGDEQVLDGRTRDAKRLTCIVEADAYRDLVSADWMTFLPDPRREALFAAVVQHARAFLRDYRRDRIKETRDAVLLGHAETLAALGPGAQLDAEEFVDEVVANDPTLDQERLSIAVQAFLKLLGSRSGQRLVVKILAMDEGDVEGLDALLDEWTVRDARAVLDEVGVRLSVVEAIRKLSGDPKVDELRTLHPLVTNARWLFGPEYDSPMFSSNETLLTVAQRILGRRVQAKTFANPRKRPDLVLLDDSTLSIVGAEGGIDPLSELTSVLLIELKRGGMTIEREQQQQAEGYVDDLLQAGLPGNPTITAYVVGAVVSPRVIKTTRRGENGRGVVHATSFSQLVDTAHRRLFRLQGQVQERFDLTGAPLADHLHEHQPGLFDQGK